MRNVNDNYDIQLSGTGQNVSLGNVTNLIRESLKGGWQNESGYRVYVHFSASHCILAATIAFKTTQFNNNKTDEQNV